MMVLCPFDGVAQWRLFVNFTPGVSIVAPSPLWVHQQEHSSLYQWAHYRSEPFEAPIYYSIRIGYTHVDKGWEIEMNHLKIYLQNTSDDLSRFSVSHGYNQLTVNRLLMKGSWVRKYGVGVVVAHPESTVRGLMYHESGGLFGAGYHIAGPVVQYGWSRDFITRSVVYLTASLMVSGAYARVPVVDGHADVPVVALHLQVGVGGQYRLRP